MERPISVAMLQCGMVGVKATATVLSGSLTCVDKGEQIAVIARQPPSPKTLFGLLIWASHPTFYRFHEH